MRNLLLLILILCTVTMATAQMTIDGQNLYGNEWIDYSKSYVKVGIDQDGMVKVTRAELLSNGMTASQIVGDDLQMFSNGKEVPLYITSGGQWTDADFLLFYGERNDGFLDAVLFENPEEDQLNCEVSIFSDIRNYYITTNPGTNNLRYIFSGIDPNTSTLATENFYMDKLQIVNNDDLWTTLSPTDPQLEFSTFLPMDGYSSTMLNDRTVELDLVNYFDGGPEPTLDMKLGSNGTSHFIQIEFNSNPIHQEIFSGAQVKNYNFVVEKNNIRPNRANFIRMRGSTPGDRMSLAVLEMTYPRTYTAAGESEYVFYTGDDNLDERVEIPDFTGTSNTLLFDLENHTVMVPRMAGTTAAAVIPGGAVRQAKMILTSDQSFRQALEISSLRMENLESLNPQYLILTSEELNKVENGSNPIEDYAAFRSSALGGGYTTQVINVEDLYDQFGYGVHEHSQAIRNFSQYMQDKWPDFELACII